MFYPVHTIRCDRATAHVDGIETEVMKVQREELTSWYMKVQREGFLYNLLVYEGSTSDGSELSPVPLVKRDFAGYFSLGKVMLVGSPREKFASYHSKSLYFTKVNIAFYHKKS